MKKYSKESLNMLNYWPKGNWIQILETERISPWLVQGAFDYESSQQKFEHWVGLVKALIKYLKTWYFENHEYTFFT